MGLPEIARGHAFYPDVSTDFRMACKAVDAAIRAKTDGLLLSITGNIKVVNIRQTIVRCEQYAE
jgi:hypothetical protein